MKQPGNEEANENIMRKEEKEQLHAIMKIQVTKRHHRLTYAAHLGDTDTLWDLITAAMEEAFVQYFDLKGAEANKMKRKKQDHHHQQEW